MKHEYSGRLVRNRKTNNIGITTADARVRTPRIPVMYLHANYPVLTALAELEDVTDRFSISDEQGSEQ